MFVPDVALRTSHESHFSVKCRRIRDAIRYQGSLELSNQIIYVPLLMKFSKILHLFSSNAY